MKTWLAAGLVCAALCAGCAPAPESTDEGRPGEAGLRDAFAAQLAANRFVTDFRRNGNEVTFAGPGPEGGSAKWRVTIDSAVVGANDDPAQPYKGTVKSSWFADGQAVTPTATESRLPFELISNGLSQDCWALWELDGKRWSWE